MKQQLMHFCMTLGFLCLSILGFAQDSFEIRLVERSINCESRRLVLDLQIRSTGNSVQLGSSSLLLNFDPYVLGIETYEPNLFDADQTCGAGNWADQSWDVSEKDGAFNLTLHRINEEGNCHTIKTNWKKIGQLFLNIKKEGHDPNLQIPIEYRYFNAFAQNDGTLSHETTLAEIATFDAGICNGELEENCEPVFSEIFTSNLSQWQSKANASVENGGLRVSAKGDNPIKTIVGIPGGTMS